MFPSITAFFAALFALIYAGLSVWVIAGRVGKNTLFGDGGDDAMLRRVRSHANFIEYVPLALVVIGLYEADGGSPTLTRVFLVLLLVARIMHPIGMFAAENTPRQFAFRGGGIIATIAILVIAAIALLAHVA
ncbi:MAG: MAPEG family protein [Caulobacteraceae bacterium]|nr:MAPEG family protein [Caulobacter sp.]